MQVDYTTQDSTRDFGSGPRPVVIIVPEAGRQGEGVVVFDIYESLPHPGSDSPCLYIASDGLTLLEVQRQAPPDGFAQTWFIGSEAVVPQNSLLVATPVDPHFWLLRRLFDSTRGSGRGEEVFRPLHDLLPPLHAEEEERAALSHSRTSEEGGNKTYDADDDVYEDGEAFFQQMRKATQASDRQRPNVTEEGGRSATDTSAREQRSPQANQDPWWSAWQRAATAQEGGPCSFLYGFLQSLSSYIDDFCDTRQHDGKTFYRFSLRKVAVWLASRVKQVLESTSLHHFLQLPPGARTSDDAYSVYRAALREAALGLVSEYVKKDLVLLLQKEVRSLAGCHGTRDRIEEAMPLSLDQLCFLLGADEGAQEKERGAMQALLKAEGAEGPRSSPVDNSGNRKRSRPTSAATGPRGRRPGVAEKGMKSLESFFGT